MDPPAFLICLFPLPFIISLPLFSSKCPAPTSCCTAAIICWLYLLVILLFGLILNARTEEAVLHNYMTESMCNSPAEPVKAVQQWKSAALTQIKMNAGNEGVHKKHEDHHAKDGHALHQEHLVSYSVLWRRKMCSSIRQLSAIVLIEVSKTRPTSLLR